jgi:hypothetical protein
VPVTPPWTPSSPQKLPLPGQLMLLPAGGDPWELVLPAPCVACVLGVPSFVGAASLEEPSVDAALELVSSAVDAAVEPLVGAAPEGVASPLEASLRAALSLLVGRPCSRLPLEDSPELAPLLREEPRCRAPWYAEVVSSSREATPLSAQPARVMARRATAIEIGGSGRRMAVTWGRTAK